MLLTKFQPSPTICEKQKMSLTFYPEKNIDRLKELILSQDVKSEILKVFRKVIEVPPGRGKTTNTTKIIYVSKIFPR